MQCEQKNPVTIVQEFCQKQGFELPIYNFTMGTVGYICEVKVAEYIASGAGRSKRDAKHLAAANVIPVLKPHFPNISSCIVAPIDELPSIDVLAQLRNYCMQNGHSLPFVEIIQDTRDQTASEYVAVCFNNTLQCRGVALNKVDARQKAGLAMLTTLQQRDRSKSTPSTNQQPSTTHKITTSNSSRLYTRKTEKPSISTSTTPKCTLSNLLEKLKARNIQRDTNVARDSPTLVNGTPNGLISRDENRSTENVQNFPKDMQCTTEKNHKNTVPDLDIQELSVALEEAVVLSPNVLGMKQNSITLIPDEAKEKLRQYKKLTGKDSDLEMDVLFCDRHNYFERYPTESKQKALKVLSDTSYKSAKQKVRDIFAALKLTPKISRTSSLTKTPMIFIEFINCPYDIVFYDKKEDIFVNILEYFKNML